MVTNVYEKFPYGTLPIKKALGIFPKVATRTRTTILATWNPSRVQKSAFRKEFYEVFCTLTERLATVAALCSLGAIRAARNSDMDSRVAVGVVSLVHPQWSPSTAVAVAVQQQQQQQLVSLCLQCRKVRKVTQWLHTVYPETSLRFTMQSERIEAIEVSADSCNVAASTSETPTTTGV